MCRKIRYPATFLRLLSEYAAHSARSGVGVRLKQNPLFGDAMKRIAAFILLLASTVALAAPAMPQRENRSIGENGREARRAQKQARKYSSKQAKRQRKAMKRQQKSQRRMAKRQQRHR
jgi:hypothetical protein